jgi:hypothetical protein
MGVVALGLMLVAELGFVIWLRGLPIREYLATRDPVSRTVYYVMLAVFALMPLLVNPGTGPNPLQERKEQFADAVSDLPSDQFAPFSIHVASSSCSLVHKTHRSNDKTCFSMR